MSWKKGGMGDSELQEEYHHFKNLRNPENSRKGSKCMVGGQGRGGREV